MTGRVLILSDLHLGKKPKLVTARLVRTIWRRSDHLVINGDAAELHDPRYCELGCRELLELQESATEDGVSLTLLAGNHDPSISNRRHLFLNNGQVLVTHGDAVHPDIAPWCHTAPIYREAYASVWDSLPHEEKHSLEARLYASMRAAEIKWELIKNQVHWIDASRLIFRPWSVLKILQYWHQYPKIAVEFVRQFEPHVKYIVTGHTHRQGIWTVDGMTVINTGCYSFPGRPRAVVIENDVMQVLPITRGSNGWVLRDKPIRSFKLESSSVLAAHQAA